jgi:hypothetical protein
MRSFTPYRLEYLHLVAVKNTQFYSLFMRLVYEISPPSLANTADLTAAAIWTRFIFPFILFSLDLELYKIY